MSNKVLKPKASTQEHLDIDDITDDLVLLKTGWVALVMRTTAVNFDLLSEAEQDATIYAYGAFLNSLSFPVETLIRNKKADITAYFQSLEQAEASQPNPDLKRQIQKYEDFLQSIVQQKTVLDKQFYLIINYSPLEGGMKGAIKGTNTNNKSKVHLVEAARAALAPKRDHVIKQTARLGLVTRQLITQELVELFYDIYNPAPTGTQRVLLDSASYATPIVEPAIENPTPADVTENVAVVNQPVHLAGTAGSVAPGGNLGNLRPVPSRVPGAPDVVGTQVQTPFEQSVAQALQQQQAPPAVAQPAYEQPVDSSQGLQPPGPTQGPAPYQGQVDQNQAAALRSLQEATARAASLVQNVPTVTSPPPLTQPQYQQPPYSAPTQPAQNIQPGPIGVNPQDTGGGK